MPDSTAVIVHPYPVYFTYDQYEQLARLLDLPWDSSSSASRNASIAAIHGLLKEAAIEDNGLSTILTLLELGRISNSEAADRILGIARDVKRRYDLRNMDPDARKAMELSESLDAFARELMGPLNLNDPSIRAIIDDVRGKGARAINMAGFGGGMADAAIAKGVGDAALSLHSQRQALGASIMGQRLKDQRELNMMKDQAARMQLEQDYQNKLAEWESQRGFGQMFLGGLGAVGGGLTGFFAGGPAGALAGASTGYQIMSGLGGSMYGGPPAAPVYRSRFYGSGGMSGRMGY